VQNLERTANNHAYFCGFSEFDTSKIILYNNSYKEKSTLLSANRRIRSNYFTIRWCFFFDEATIKISEGGAAYAQGKLDYL